MWTENNVIELGTRPGSLSPQDSVARLRWARFNRHALHSGEVEDFASLPAVASGETLWLDIEGVPGHAGLLALQQAYGLHQLALEDVQNGGQNPKLEEFERHLYLVLQLPHLSAQGVRFEQLNLFLAKGLIVSIHRRPDLFEPVRRRLELGQGTMRGGGTEYLLYALSDLAVDHGLPVAQAYTEALLDLENRIEGGEADLSQEIYAVRRQLSALQRQAQRQRDELRRLLRPQSSLLTGEYEIFWRDCVDHAERYYESVTYLRESAADLLNTHLALISHRMNDVMKVLTIMSTIFVPLSFLVGLYGMNFDTGSPYNLPELGWRFGYAFVWSLMLLVVAGVLLFFRGKKWL